MGKAESALWLRSSSKRSSLCLHWTLFTCSLVHNYWILGARLDFTFILRSMVIPLWVAANNSLLHFSHIIQNLTHETQSRETIICTEQNWFYLFIICNFQLFVLYLWQVHLVLASLWGEDYSQSICSAFLIMIIPPIRDFLIDFAKSADISLIGDDISALKFQHRFCYRICIWNLSWLPCDGKASPRLTRYHPQAPDSIRDHDLWLCSRVWAKEACCLILGGWGGLLFLFSRATTLAIRACMVGLLLWEVTVL